MERLELHLPGSGPTALTITGEPVDRPWEYFLNVYGEKVFRVGLDCESCGLVLSREAGAPLTASPVVELLNTGMTSLTETIVAGFSTAMPPGAYSVSLLQCAPREVMAGSRDDYLFLETWGQPDYPLGLSEYYRGRTEYFAPRRGLFEIFVPFQPRATLRQERIDAYAARLTSGGDLPTIVAFSLLDVQEPNSWQDSSPANQHWCLVHYVIDGHHKMAAAAATGRPLTLLSFLPHIRGAHYPARRETLVQPLRRPRDA